MTLSPTNNNIVTLLKAMGTSPLFAFEQLVPDERADLLDQLHGQSSPGLDPPLPNYPDVK